MARSVTTQDEIQRIKDFGLGRGIDCTDEFPWINKKPIQVCAVELETVIGTEEGGALDSFDHVVDGAQDSKPVKCVLPIAPMSLDLDVEYSRSSTQNRHTIGKKVVTRTIALKPPGTRPQTEERNDAAIMGYYKNHQVTHYVSEIQLGAMMYHTTTVSQYTSLVSNKGVFGAEKIKPLSISLEGSKSYKKTKNVSNLKQIGKISAEGTVERGSHDEAVVKVKFESITSLVRDKEMQSELQSLIKEYTKSRNGQFKITCNEGKLFLKVDLDGAVRGTPNKEDGTYFSLIAIDGGKDSDEFVLGYYRDEGSSDGKSAAPLASYLQVTRSCFRESEPLRMVDHAREERSRLTAFSRLYNGDRTVSPVEWTRGEDMFYICTRTGRFRRRGYLCVKDAAPYNTACTTSRYSPHNHTFFRVVPRREAIESQVAAPFNTMIQADR